MEIAILVGAYLCLLVLVAIVYLLYSANRYWAQQANAVAQQEIQAKRTMNEKLDAIYQILAKIDEALLTQIKGDESNYQKQLEKLVALQQAAEKIDKTLNETLTLD